MLKPTLSEVIDHIRSRAYMGGVERDQLRVKATGEVFTPTELVREMLEQIPIEQFQDPAKTFLDNSCGDGQFLGEVLIRKMENGNTFEQALSTTYGVDLMQDNVDLCRERLLCGREDLRHIVEQNIYQADALKFSYKFKPMSATRRTRENKLRNQVLTDIKATKNAAVFETSKTKKKP
jgi:type I restriction-modification system DNA methylase subunit